MRKKYNHLSNLKTFYGAEPRFEQKTTPLRDHRLIPLLNTLSALYTANRQTLDKFSKTSQPHGSTLPCLPDTLCKILPC